MKKNSVYLITLICLILPLMAIAEESKWQDEAELSYVNTGGNTEVTSLSGKNKLTYQFTEDFKGQWEVSALYGETEDVKTAERYATEVRLDYNFTDRIYLAGIGGWLQDEFAGIDQRLYIGPALGYKILTGPKHILSVEGGIDYVTEKYTEPPGSDEEDDFDDDAEFMRGRAFGSYEFILTEKSKFTQSLELLYDFEDGDNYNVNSVSALITSLSDTFSIKTSYEVHYDNEPVPDFVEETDTILSVALIVNFK
jgi:putative salt-induced outer membrane protein